MARVKLSVELDIDIDLDDADAESNDAKAITEDDLRYAAQESVVEALEFVQHERGFMNPFKMTAIEIYDVNLVK